ncbi:MULTISPECIES: aldose 1-epimerase family protein [unclassified Arthrobacter]|uniref:aldose 1-epimerase family protein n=1 Tax=unclassified Arthrobacter TaxID=235627 RepID=UPI002119C5F3|nr:aldose 1-epimerase family protein [Arthrobacter sp. STN4]MCQ9163723.1 aldose 1-epimerase family protein [Arthrobacter sp. STN4]
MNGSGYLITSGGYTARIVPRGAALCELRHRGRDLVVPFAPGAPVPDFRGIIAAPWPNRVADGTYRWDGAGYRLPLNEPGRGTALHGLVHDVEWALETHDDDRLALRCSVAPSEGYPSALEVRAGYVLDADGLHCTVTAINVGAAAAPYGVCPHPYLVAGDAPLDEWTLSLPASSFLAVTADRLLPLGLESVAGHEFDFREPRAIGATQIDHAFTNMAADVSGASRLLLSDPSGTYVGVQWDGACPWLQIHTADKPAGQPGRRGLAVEPMTCPPDAFNSGTDLIRLEPGGMHTAGWSIFGG